MKVKSLTAQCHIAVCLLSDLLQREQEIVGGHGETKSCARTKGRCSELLCDFMA